MIRIAPDDDMRDRYNITLWRKTTNLADLEIVPLQDVWEYDVELDVQETEFPWVEWNKQRDAVLHLRFSDVYGSTPNGIVTPGTPPAKSVLDGDIVVEYGLGSK